MFELLLGVFGGAHGANIHVLVTVSTHHSNIDTSLAKCYITAMEILKSYMDTQGLSSKDMAARLKMDPGQFSKLLAGKHEPTLSTLHRICQVTNIPVAKLVADCLKV